MTDRPDPPVSYRNDIDSPPDVVEVPPDIEQQLAEVFRILQAVKDAMVEAGLVNP